MKETVGNTFVLKLVLIFTLLFTAFLALSITYNKVFRVKNEVLTIIEKYEGINDSSLTVINNFLSSSSYLTTGKCNEGFSGVKDYNNNSYDKEAANGEKYYYCFKEMPISASDEGSTNGKKYYQVGLFYKLNLPIIGDIITYQIKGKTKAIISM